MQAALVILYVLPYHCCLTLAPTKSGTTSVDVACHLFIDRQCQHETHRST